MAGCSSGFNARYIAAYRVLVAPDNRPGMRQIRANIHHTVLAQRGKAAVRFSA